MVLRSIQRYRLAMAYAIMRSKKLSSMGSVAASLQHCFRERETPNARSDLTPRNSHLSATSTDQAMGKLRELLPEKRRKDAVLVVEYVMTASPDWWKTASPAQQQQFFDNSVQWLSDKYGAKNIFSASVHLDEQTPHLSAFVAPITADGRLSAKEFIGSKAKMTADQTSFAKAVQSLGLERGIEGSHATHQRVQSFYGDLGKQEDPIAIRPEDLKPKILEKGFLTNTVESPADVALRLNKRVKETYAPVIAKAIQAERALRRADEAESALKALRKAVEPILRALTPLSAAGKRLLSRIIEETGEKLYREEERERHQDRDLERGPRDRGGRGR